MEERQLWLEWLARRKEAEARAETFTEPPPNGKLQPHSPLEAISEPPLPEWRSLCLGQWFRPGALAPRLPLP